MRKCLLAIACSVASSPFVLRAAESWEQEPILYSDTVSTDVIAKLAEDLASGKRVIEGERDLDKLKFVLRLLAIPEESQILVYSKTSHQNSLIRPENPRCLFYNENAYVGYVPGGDIEIVIQEPALGSVYYLINLEQKAPARMIIRDNNICLSCHGTGRTEAVPGVLVRSVHPDANGQLLLQLGTSLIDARSPIPTRWGGYYVTGRSSLPHLGNRVYQETDQRDDGVMPPEFHTLDDKIDVSKYPRNTSDIVSLMVLEYQCRVHNLLVAASMEYRRAYWFQKSLEPSANPDEGRAGRSADAMAAKLIEALLFKDEASLGDGGVDGDIAFQDALVKRFPKTKAGDSLADFQLNDRLFKNRCSYMIYSQAFEALPERVKSVVYSGLKKVFEHGEGYPGIKASERLRIAAILNETVRGYRDSR